MVERNAGGLVVDQLPVAAAFLPHIHYPGGEQVGFSGFCVEAAVEDESGIDGGVLERAHFPIAGLGRGFLVSTYSGQDVAFGDGAASYGDTRVIVCDQFVDRRDTMMRFGFIEALLQAENH